jgi:phage terminase large subunit-like protein
VIDSAEKQASWWWGWDIAWGTRKSSDWSVGVLVGRTPKGITIIADAIRFRAPAHITIQVIRKCAELTGRQVPLVLPHDPGAAKETQSDWALELTNAGFEAHLVADDAKTGSKVARCRLLSTQAERNEFKLLRSHESVGVARWLAQQTSKVGQRVEVSTCQEWHRQIVEALDQLADDCPHWVTDWTDAITKAYNFTIRYDAISPAEVGKPSPPARGNWGTGESWASLSWR